MEDFSSEHSIGMLCDIARVSLSGYYAWKQRIFMGTTRDEREKEDMVRIEAIVRKYHRKHGYRIITMKL